MEDIKGVVGAGAHWCKIKPEGYVAVRQVKMLGKSFQEEGRTVYVGQRQVVAWYIPRSQRGRAEIDGRPDQTGKPGTIYVI